MSAIGTTSSYAGDISALLLVNSSSASTTTDPAGAAAQTSPASSSGGDDRGPATNVQLSDQVKSILAQANGDAVVAQRLQTFVELQQTGGSSDGSSAGDSSKIDVDKAFQQLSGGTQAGSDAQTQEPVQVVKSFATGLKADGYTVSALASDVDGSSRIVIFGPNGFSFLDEHFGRSDEATSGSSAGPGTSESEYQAGNVEYVTLSQNVAASTSVDASSSAGSASASSTAAQSSTTTIAIDFNTGAISLTQSESLSVSTTAQVGQPGSAFSTVA